MKRVAWYTFSGLAVLSLLVCAWTLWQWASGEELISDPYSTQSVWPFLSRYRYRYTEHLISWWYVLGPAMICPAIWVREWLPGALARRSRRLEGRCGRCGYDLTGNVSGVCPECGTACETRPCG